MPLSPSFYLFLSFIVMPFPLFAGTTYTVGVVPQYEARRLRHIWQPILNHLETETGEKLELMGSPTIPTFEAEFMDGEFDFAYMNPYHLVVAYRKVGYQPLVRDVGRNLFGVLGDQQTGRYQRNKRPERKNYRLSRAECPRGFPADETGVD